mmetsp:Transcript_43148/g.101858  ORF Transcript_43148/g.101858 Transcript_43148/m.101858 type:complete len:358 (-) Transcript_43148:404-1477(-)
MFLEFGRELAHFLHQVDSLVVEHPVVDAVGEELGQVRGRAGVLVQVDEQTRHFVELRPVVLQQRQLAVRLADLHEVGVAMVLDDHVLSHGLELVRDPIPVRLVCLVLLLETLCPLDQHPLRPHGLRVRHRLEADVDFLHGHAGPDDGLGGDELHLVVGTACLHRLRLPVHAPLHVHEPPQPLLSRRSLLRSVAVGSSHRVAALLSFLLLGQLLLLLLLVLFLAARIGDARKRLQRPVRRPQPAVLGRVLDDALQRVLHARALVLGLALRKGVFDKLLQLRRPLPRRALLFLRLLVTTWARRYRPSAVSMSALLTRGRAKRRVLLVVPPVVVVGVTVTAVVPLVRVRGLCRLGLGRCP